MAKAKKRIVVIGAGVVGVACATRLSQDGHDVVVIDHDERATAELVDRLDVQVIAGSGSSLPVLRSARLDQADLLLAVTNSDEVNMITALIAGSTFHCSTKVVRLRSDEYLENIAELSSNWPGTTHGINPDLEAANRIESLLDVPHATDVARVLDGRVVVAGFRVQLDCPLRGKSMSELRKIFPDERFLVAAVYRNARALLPDGDFELAVGDTAYFSSMPDRIPQLVRLMGYSFDREERVVVSGGGHVAAMVARKASRKKLPVTLLMRDLRRAEKLAVEYPETLVLSGDVTDESILREAGADRATSFIAATDDQETNLLSSVLAKRIGASRVITLVDNKAYLSLADKLDIDAVVSPRLAAVSEILRFVRGQHFEQVASLPMEKIEVAVVEVDAGSPLCDRPLRELDLPDGMLITAVASTDGVFIPGGSDVIPAGSHAVIFSLAEAAALVAEFLEAGS